MKTIHVGGLNPIGRAKSLSDALAKAKDDDTIVLHKNETVAVTIDKNIIIKGNGHTLTVETGKAGIHVDAPIVIENTKFLVNSRANALVISAKTILDDVSVSLVGPIREFYPVVFVKSGTTKINGGKYTMLSTDSGSHVKLNDVELYSYYGGDIHLSTADNTSKFYGDVEIRNSILAYSQFYGSTNINNSTITKFVDNFGHMTISDSILSPESTEATIKLKKEPERGPLQNQTNSKYVLKNIQSELVLDNYNVGTVSDGFLGIYASDSVLTVRNIENEYEDISHTIENSTVTFENAHDQNYWGLEKTTTSFVRSQINSNSKSKTAKEKMDELIGLDKVKEQIQTIMNTIELNRANDNKNFAFSYNMIFAGAPGTGKTTVSELTAEALFEIGAIRENKITKVTVDDLIKGYVGQTAANVRDILDKARGGVIFIDEAYQLTVKDGQNTFNDEALSVLIRYMEDYRDDLVVIAAGYNKEMTEFLASNVGLARRFQWIDFEDYTPDEMAKIFELIRKSYDDEYENPILAKAIPTLFDKLVKLNLSIPDANGRITNGGNGGLVRNVYQRIAQARNNRAITGDTMALTKADIEAGFKAEMQNTLSRKL